MSQCVASVLRGVAVYVPPHFPVEMRPLQEQPRSLDVRVLLCVAVCSSVFQCVAVSCCRVRREHRFAVRCMVLQCIAMCRIVLQCDAVSCIIMQCVVL